VFKGGRIVIVPGTSEKARVGELAVGPVGPVAPVAPVIPVAPQTAMGGNSQYRT